MNEINPAPLAGDGADCTPTVDEAAGPVYIPTNVDHGEAERACRAANLAWAVVAWRLPARTAREHLEQLRKAGRLYDETHPLFAGVLR